MMDSDAQPTLLIFTLGPDCEGARRQLMPAPLRQAESLLHQHGLCAALDAGRRAGLRLVVASPETLDLPEDVEQLHQAGCSFAERLRRAVRALQADSRDAPLLVVGTDTPDLDVHHLLAAVSWLDGHAEGVALGPSHDGGFYLLAARRSLDLELSGVRWCRNDTRRSLMTAIRHHGRPVLLLAPLRDLDRFSDVEAWLSRHLRHASAWLARLLRSLLANWRRPLVHGIIPRLAPTFAASSPGRSPPS